jgi:AcrR family transcriptional regulator
MMRSVPIISEQNGLFRYDYQMATSRRQTRAKQSSEPDPSPLSGRRQQAARNDQLILDAAREVFLANPSAPISHVARHAGVGISALYLRYPSKEELLRTLCANGLQTFLAETEAALADDRDDWTVFADYMQRIVDADTSALTLALAGRFTPTPEMHALAQRTNQRSSLLFNRFKPSLRPGLTAHDLSLVFELVAAIKLADHTRTRQLRRRYLAIILDGIRATTNQPLPGPGPNWQEMTARWTT